MVLALAALSALVASAAAAYTLSGTVYGGSSKLVGATLNLLDVGTSAQVGTASTDSLGLYSFTIADGTYNLSVSATGFEDSVVNGIVVSGVDVVQDIVLLRPPPPPPPPPPTYKVSGKVLISDGSPVAGARVYVEMHGPQHEGPWTVYTDTAGAYAVTGLSQALVDDRESLKINVTGGSNPGLPKGYSAQTVLFMLLGDKVIDFSVPTSDVAWLHGSVLNGLGATVPNVTVALATSTVVAGTTTIPTITYRATASCKSDAMGGYSINGVFMVPTGTVTLTPTGTGVYIVSSFSGVALSADSSRDFVIRDYVPPPPPPPVPTYEVSGTVLLSDGSPVAGAKVFMEMYGPDHEGPWTVYTDAAGAYAVIGLPQVLIDDMEQLRITVTLGANPGLPKGYSAQTAYFVFSGDRSVDFSVPASGATWLHGLVLNSLGATVPNVTVALATSVSVTGTTAIPTIVYRATASSKSDATGGYSIDGVFMVPSGTVTLTPTATGPYVTTSFSGVALTADSSRDFVIKDYVPPPPVPTYKVTGTVLMADGSPVAGAKVYTEMYGPDHEGPWTVYTDAAGAYAVTGLPQVLIDDMEKLGVTVTLGSNPGLPAGYSAQTAYFQFSGDTVVDFSVPSYSGSFRGRSTDSNGVAVPNVTFAFTSSQTINSVTYRSTASVNTGTGGSYVYAGRFARSLCSVAITPPSGSGFASASLSNVALGTDHLINVILPLPDKWPPVIISPPVVNNLSQTEATISWQTDEPTKGGVNYGLSAPPGTVLSESTYVTNHSVVLTGLVPDTTYHVSAFATDSTNNGPVGSGVISFSTRALPDSAPPVHSAGPIVSGISHNSATVEWRTDEPTTGTVHYGPTDALGQTANDGLLALEHRVVLTGLSAESGYFVQVQSTDTVGNGPTPSPILGFHTVAAPDTTAPGIVEGPLAFDLTDTTATIVWNTDEPATSSVSWNDGTAYDLTSDPSLTTAHLVTLTNLQPGKTYFYTVSTTDAGGNGPTLCQTGTFTTKPGADVLPPVFTEITPVHVVNEQKAQIKWLTDEPSDSVVEFGLTAGALTESESKSGLVTRHTVDLNHLEADTLYFFRLVSRDERGNAAASAVMSFRTTAHGAVVDNGPQVTLAPELVYASDDKATVLWETDVPTDTVVEYSAPGQPVQRRSDAEKNQKHQVTLTNLAAGENYTVTVSGTDARGGQVALRLGARGAFVADAGGGFAPTTSLSTAAFPDAAAPALTSGPAVIWRSDRMALVRWTTDEIADSVVRFGLAGQPRAEVAGDIVDAEVHEVVLTNLAPGATYDCQVESTDPAGNGPTPSAVTSFTTLAAPDASGPAFTGAPLAVTIGADTAVLEWETAEPATTELRHGLAAGALSLQAGAAGIAAQHALTLTGLSDCTQYFVAAVARDLVGNESVSGTASFTTVCVNDPPIATDDAATTAEDTPIDIDVMANDLDPDGGQPSFVVPAIVCPMVFGVPCLLPYAPPADFFGTEVVSYTISDGIGTATAAVTVTVTAVNDPPNFTKGADQAVTDDAGAQDVTGWATGIAAGPANESAQALTFLVSNDNAALFSAQPAVAANGALTYAPAAGADGSATVTVALRDDGGTAAGGADTSAAQTFTITVNRTCSYAVTPTSLFLPAHAALGSIAVTAPPECGWTVSQPDGWIAVTSEASGSGSGTVTFSAAANPGPGPRSWALLVAGTTVAIEQASQAPTASFVGIVDGAAYDNPFGPATLDVAFDARGSRALTAIENYHWAFGDGDTDDTATAVVGHSYAATGSYPVTLTVTAGGRTATAQRLVTVADLVHHVATAGELQAALTAAQDNGKHDLIRMAAGFYPLSENGGAHFAYRAPALENKDLALEGGWTPDFSQRASNLPTILLRDQSPPGTDDGGVLLLDGAAGAASGSFTLDSLTIDGGSTTGSGGGLFAVSGGGISLSNSAITNNAAAGAGGGLLLQSGSGAVRITGCTIAGNAGGSAGAVAVSAAAAHLLANEISGNSAIGNGGLQAAIRPGGELIVGNNTIHGNAATAGSAGLTAGLAGAPLQPGGGSGPARFDIHNNIIYGNAFSPGFSVDPDCAHLYGGIELSVIGNDLEDAAVCADYPLDPSNVAVEPWFIANASVDIRLRADDTLLIDAGTNSLLPPRDLDGDEVPIDGGSGTATADIGADEYEPANPTGPTALGLTAFPASILAAGGSTTATVSLDRPAKRDLVLYVSHADTNIPSPGQPLVTVTPLYLRIPKGTSSAAITVQARVSAFQGTSLITASDPSGALSAAEVSVTVAIAPDTQAPTGSVQINSGAAATNSGAVTLSLAAADTGGSGLASMRFRNAEAEPYGEWEPYQSTRAWTLAGGTGTRRVFVQFADAAGNVSDANAAAAGAQAYRDDIVVYDDIVRPTGSVLINNGAAVTSALIVTLKLTAADTGGSGLGSMRLRNRDVDPWSAWEAYQPTRSWTLTSGAGPKKVYAQFMDNAGNCSDANPDAAGAQGYLDSIVVDFDAARPTGSVLINNGAASTANAAVTLNLAATDTGGSGLASMRFRNSDLEPYTPWEPYQITKSWLLLPGAGTRKVSVQFVDGAGNVSDANPAAAGAQGFWDSIALNP